MKGSTPVAMRVSPIALRSVACCLAGAVAPGVAAQALLAGSEPSLTLSLEKEGYLVGEPIEVCARAVNETEQAQYLLPLGLHSGLLRFEISDAQGRPLPRLRSRSGWVTSADNVVPAGGHGEGCDVLDLWFGPLPAGRYTLRAGYPVSRLGPQAAGPAGAHAPPSQVAVEEWEEIAFRVTPPDRDRLADLATRLVMAARALIALTDNIVIHASTREAVRDGLAHAESEPTYLAELATYAGLLLYPWVTMEGAAEDAFPDVERLATATLDRSPYRYEIAARLEGLRAYRDASDSGRVGGRAVCGGDLYRLFRLGPNAEPVCLEAEGTERACFAVGEGLSRFVRFPSGGRDVRLRQGDTRPLLLRPNGSTCWPALLDQLGSAGGHE